jgi:hypothetical protein
MQSRKIKKGGHSNLKDCYAISQNKKERKHQYNRMQSKRAKLKKGGNSNLIDCNAIAQNKKKGGNSNLIDCNAITQNKKGR